MSPSSPRVAALCLCTITSIFSSSSTSLSPGHISLRGQSPGYYSAVWEGDTVSSLTQTCYKSTLFLCVCVWGRGFSHHDPIASSVHLACERAEWHTRRRHARQQPAFLTLYMWLSGPTMGWCATKILSVETTHPREISLNEHERGRRWSCAVRREKMTLKSYSSFANWITERGDRFNIKHFGVTRQLNSWDSCFTSSSM